MEAAIAFFTDLGLTVLGRDTVSGEWTDTAVGLDGNHANIAMLQTPDGNGRPELFEYIHPDAIETKPTRPNEIGMHRAALVHRLGRLPADRYGMSPKGTAEAAGILIA
jgi:glyoxylase I family protein